MINRTKRTLNAWREARHLSLDDVARLAGVDPDELRRWERTGYPTHQGGPVRAIALADALQAPLEMIDFGPHVRGFTAAGCQFVLATNGRDDRGWETFVAEWRTAEHGSRGAPGGLGTRANSRMRTPGRSSPASLDRVEGEIRQLINAAPCNKRGDHWSGSGMVRVFS
jgi:transcriptional regulator with XRE-family HTH domain